jgi:hypothetical protein
MFYIPTDSDLLPFGKSPLEASVIAPIVPLPHEVPVVHHGIDHTASAGKHVPHVPANPDFLAVFELPLERAIIIAIMPLPTSGLRSAGKFNATARGHATAGSGRGDFRP